MTITDLATKLFDDADKSLVDPFAVFELWFAEASDSEVNDPNAMALATVDATGLPDVRTVLLNARDERGFTFFTNFESAKGRQLLANPRAALLFHWKSLRRQIRIRGAVEQVSPSEASDYFATRPRQSQIGAHASAQSRPLGSRAELVAKTESVSARFGEQDVPRPDYWSGFRVVPSEIEFWKDGAFRLHDRVLFTRIGGGWKRQRLNP